MESQEKQALNPSLVEAAILTPLLGSLGALGAAEGKELEGALVSGAFAPGAILGEKGGRSLVQSLGSKAPIGSRLSRVLGSKAAPFIGGLAGILGGGTLASELTEGVVGDPRIPDIKRAAHLQGFIDKCAEYDIDPEELVKSAGIGSALAKYWDNLSGAGVRRATSSVGEADTAQSAAYDKLKQMMDADSLNPGTHTSKEILEAADILGKAKEKRKALGNIVDEARASRADTIAGTALGGVSLAGLAGLASLLNDAREEGLQPRREVAWLSGS